MAGPNKGKGKTYKWLVDHVSYKGEDCLPWPFAKDERIGRGLLGHLGKHYWAHRLMCQLAHGAPPTPKHQAAHECGKGHYGCVNPRHLAWKTNSENQIDRRKTGNMLRNRHGSRTVLKPEQIAEIRLLSETATQVEIARQFGVSLGCVQYWLKYRAIRNTGTNRSFSEEEDAYLLQQPARTSLQKMAADLGRTPGSVRGHLGRMRQKKVV